MYLKHIEHLRKGYSALNRKIPPILQIIFQKSVKTGVLLSIWKSANVTPAFNIANKSNTANYRPSISLTKNGKQKMSSCTFVPELIQSPVPSSLLEHLRCHTTDEYPVISTDDESPIPPLACGFSKARNTAHILALVDENGSSVIYDTNKAGENALLTDWTAHSNAVFDVKWMWTEEKLLTGSGDQTVCLWDVKTTHKLLTFKGHTSSVRSLGFRPRDDAVFSSGSRDGHVRLWDVRCNVKDKKVSSVNIIRNAHTVPLQLGTKRKKSRLGTTQAQDSQQSVTCVVFQNDNLLATSGAVDGCVKVWDIRKIKPDSAEAVYSFPYTGVSKRTHGFSSLTFDMYYSRLFASCTDDIIYSYDFATYNPHPVCSYRGHRNTSFYVRAVVSPDNQFLFSGSSDENAYIWQIGKPNASPVILQGHRSEISDVAWCDTDLFRLVTTSDDNTMRVWRFDPTAELRKKLGRSDLMCDITGTAQRTHRDIGVSAESAPQTPKRSPHAGLKRSASVPFGGVIELTPKRPRTPSTASPSPSIKMWLKRSSSDSAASPTQGTSKCEPKRLKLASVDEKESNCGESDINNGNAAECDTKKLQVESCSRVESAGENVIKDSKEQSGLKAISNSKLGKSQKVSCKRKLDDSEHSPEKSSKRKRTVSENPDKTSASHVSPRKRDTFLKDLKSEINASPEKRGDNSGMEYFSPARVRMLDLDSKDFVQSPTTNLPNLVIDGPSENKTVSEEVNKTKTVDWLTQMRIQKKTKQSPKSKVCRGKLLDKLTQSSQESEPTATQTTSSTVQSPKSKSPVRGVKSITSFFRRQATIP